MPHAGKSQSRCAIANVFIRTLERFVNGHWYMFDQIPEYQLTLRVPKRNQFCSA